MAFGKDPEQLNKIAPYGGNFIQRAKAAAKRPEKTNVGNRSGSYYWTDCYRPSEHAPDIIRLIAGAYPQEVTHDGENITIEEFPFWMYREHHNGTVGSICCAGPLWMNKELGRPCPPCKVFWEDVAERKNKKARGDTTKGPNRMSARDQFAFNVFDYSLYFKVPQVDKSGQVRMNQKTNQPFFNWVKGHPNDPKFHGLEWKQGHLLPWVMNGTHKETLIAHAKRIGNCCATCASMDSISCLAKVCQNCHQVIYEPATSVMTPEQQDSIDNYPYTCTKCSFKGYVDEFIQCANPNCPGAKRASIFDVDLQVQRLDAGEKNKILQVLNFSPPRPIQVTDPAVLETLKPLPLDKKFAAHTPKEANKIFGWDQAPAMQAYVPPPPQATPPIMTEAWHPNGQPVFPPQPQLTVPFGGGMMQAVTTGTGADPQQHFPTVTAFNK